jgi:hypothetical protein
MVKRENRMESAGPSRGGEQPAGRIKLLPLVESSALFSRHRQQRAATACRSASRPSAIASRLANASKSALQNGPEPRNQPRARKKRGCEATPKACGADLWSPLTRSADGQLPDQPGAHHHTRSMREPPGFRTRESKLRSSFAKLAGKTFRPRVRADSSRLPPRGLIRLGSSAARGSRIGSALQCRGAVRA